MKQHIDSYLETANSLRFKIWAIVGKNAEKKANIIHYLQEKNWTLIDANEELKHLAANEPNQEIPHNIGTKVKEWFLSKPNNIILLNMDFLYLGAFRKISPIGALKYSSRSKNCILFLEDEKLIGNRISFGTIGSEEYYDQDVSDILASKIDDIKEDYTPIIKKRKIITDTNELSKDAIGQLFNYTPIKDVVDIDSDMKHLEIKKELISSFIISNSLENQILDFYENISNPKHKAVKIVGNYGSGKSHLIAFLLTSIIEKDFRQLIKNDKVKEAALKVNRHFWVVQFELMSGEGNLSSWFYNEIHKQLKEKYAIEIPLFNSDNYNHKDNINLVISQLKAIDPLGGLVVVIDEVSDFLAQKELHLLNRDLQFLRVVAQVCQDTDLLLVTSMQEDVYTSSKFKNIADQETRISERFQNIQIHKENIKKVISERIVPKTAQQVAELSVKLKKYSEKMNNVSNHFDEYLNLFPFTPFLLSLFDELPYFEKRGVIQFAQTELKYVLNEPFPYFFTFDKIYDLLTTNPNHANLEEIYQSINVVNIIESKINTSIDEHLRNDALKIVKGLVLFSLWTKGNNGATMKQLAENLLILPNNSALETYQYAGIIIKKIRIATDNFYIKVEKNKETNDDYVKFDPMLNMANPDEKIESEIITITTDQVETEIFNLIKETLGLEFHNQTPNLFDDECSWLSVKSFRKGYVVFIKQGTDFETLNDRDYVIAFVSPFVKEKIPVISKNQLNIRIVIKEENTEIIKQLAAINQLINKRILTSVMSKKREELINGNREKNSNGLKYYFARWIRTISECDYNGKKIFIQNLISKETDVLTDIFSDLKIKLFDKEFTELFSEHPKYSMQLTSTNINNSLTPIAQDVAEGDFTKLSYQKREFLKTLQLLNENNFPSINSSKIAVNILNIINNNKERITDIQKEIIEPFAKPPYGLEPEVIHLVLVLLATEGKISFKMKGETIDLSNIKQKFKSLAQFEIIKYAVRKEDFSFDFAARLIHALGLNGAMIKQENTRAEVFKQYKERIKLILDEFATVNQLIEKLKIKPKLFLDILHIEQLFNNCKLINWNSLFIDYYNHFASINSLDDKIPEIKQSSETIFQLGSALRLYDNEIHNGFDYMEKALDIIENNQPFVSDEHLQTNLSEIYNSALSIVKETDKFMDIAYNRTLSGKLKEFKNKYINEFYYTAHENTVGQKVNWHQFANLENNPLYKKIAQISKIDYIGIAELNNKLKKWDSILKHECDFIDLDKMQQVPFCTACSFMNKELDYSAIQKEIDNFDVSLQTIYTKFVSNAIGNITQNSNKLDLINIPAEHKTKIKQIVANKELPEILDNFFIISINELFKKVQIKEFSRKDIEKILFPEDKLFTWEELQKNWYALEEKIKGNDNENELRIKIID